MQENTVATAPERATPITLEGLRAQGAVARSLTHIEQSVRSAAWIAVSEGFPAAGELLDKYLEGDLAALMERVVPLLAVRGVPPMERHRQERRAAWLQEASASSASSAGEAGAQPMD